MKKARLIITFDCNKHCDGCCNTHDIAKNYKTITSMEPLLDYDEIMITGGEPMLMTTRIYDILHFLRAYQYQGLVYLYTAYLIQPQIIFFDILSKIDGLHYTLHYECKDNDIIDLKEISAELNENTYKAHTRLAIDKRVYERYDLSNIDFHGWDVIRKMEWQINCPLPEGEELLYLDIK